MGGGSPAFLDFWGEIMTAVTFKVACTGVGYRVWVVSSDKAIHDLAFQDVDGKSVTVPPVELPAGVCRLHWVFSGNVGDTIAIVGTDAGGKDVVKTGERAIVQGASGFGAKGFKL